MQTQVLVLERVHDENAMLCIVCDDATRWSRAKMMVDPAMLGALQTDLQSSFGAVRLLALASSFLGPSLPTGRFSLSTSHVNGLRRLEEVG